MVSSGTHLVKNHESLSRTNEAQLKNHVSRSRTNESQLKNHVSQSRTNEFQLKNHVSQSRTNESQFKKQGVMLEPLCNQTVNLETDAKTLYYSLLKLKYSSSIYSKHKKDWNKYASLNNSHTNHTNRMFYEKASNRSIVLCHELFCVFWDFYASGRQDAVVAKSLP